MAKLYFRYGAMESFKSVNILIVCYNYEERGQYVVLLKPKTDNRDGEYLEILKKLRFGRYYAKFISKSI